MGMSSPGAACRASEEVLGAEVVGERLDRLDAGVALRIPRRHRNCGITLTRRSRA
jgi:hypothetical protein